MGAMASNGCTQRTKLFAVLGQQNHCGENYWWSLQELASVTGFPVQSISARLRDFRKLEYGGHVVLRRATDTPGLFEYRLVRRPREEERGERR